jgi:hypothetical protein
MCVGGRRTRCQRRAHADSSSPRFDRTLAGAQPFGEPRMREPSDASTASPSPVRFPSITPWIVACLLYGCGGRVPTSVSADSGMQGAPSPDETASVASDGGTFVSQSDSGIETADAGTSPSQDAGTSPSQMDGGASTAVGQGSWGVPLDGGPWSPVCPLSNPGEGAACSQLGLQCEYGDAWWDVSCNQVLVCLNGVFTSQSFGGSTCEPQPGPNPPSCPPDTGSFTSNIACPPAENGLICSYGQGSSCTCQTLRGVPDSGTLWECNPESGCPSTRPRIGEPCNGGLTCAYVEGVWGSRLGRVAIPEYCSRHVWQISMGGA